MSTAVVTAAFAVHNVNNRVNSFLANERKYELPTGHNKLLMKVKSTVVWHHHHTTPHHTTTVLRPFFRDHPGEPEPEENF